MISLFPIDLSPDSTLPVVVGADVHEVIVHVAKRILLNFLGVFHIEKELKIHQIAHIFLFLLILQELLLQGGLELGGVLEKEQPSPRDKAQSDSTQDSQVVWKPLGYLPPIVKIMSSLLQSQIVRIHGSNSDQGEDQGSNPTCCNNDDANSGLFLGEELIAMSDR
jgi:hypothetical protein